MYRIKYVQRKGFSYSTQCPITSTKKKKKQNSNRISFTSKEADFWYVFAVYIILLLQECRKPLPFLSVLHLSERRINK